ncbi:hypothetical protein JKG68_09635 [Microvirga aerilata]|uniref:Uncharacterized protein n=1 Tax=Microvirga aerilata TaxID=670292 RepID=A0A936Z844_9HYPH|nr:hypothetical protein [Microvirga aerilata]MBL0404227.1 hypothetical protein [Microvirga aerilata]
MTDSAALCANETSEELQGQPEPSGLPLTPQALIDVLIDIDLAYERKCKELSKSNLGATLQYHLLEKLRVQHSEQREPFAQRLIALQDELKAKGDS